MYKSLSGIDKAALSSVTIEKKSLNTFGSTVPSVLDFPAALPNISSFFTFAAPVGITIDILQFFVGSLSIAVSV